MAGDEDNVSRGPLELDFVGSCNWIAGDIPGSRGQDSESGNRRERRDPTARYGLESAGCSVFRCQSFLISYRPMHFRLRPQRCCHLRTLFEYLLPARQFSRSASSIAMVSNQSAGQRLVLVKVVEESKPEMGGCRTLASSRTLRERGRRHGFALLLPPLFPHIAPHHSDNLPILTIEPGDR